MVNKIIYRLNKSGKKLFNIDNKIIFCSGKVELANNIINKYYNDKNKSIDNLKIITEYYYNEYINNNIISENNFILDILIATFENEQSIVYQISPYDNFEIKKNIITNINDIGIYVAGIKVQEAYDIIYNNILNKINVSNIYQNAFDNISFEGIGGYLEVYKLNNNNIELYYKNNIKEKNSLKYLNDNFNTLDKNYLIGERVIGKLLCGINLQIDASDEEGNKFFTVDQNGVNITNLILSLLRTDNKTKILMDANSGMKIQKNTGTELTPVWEDVLYINNDGDLVTKGNIEIGEDSSVFKADSNGIYLGSQNFSDAPFRVNPMGHLTAESADIKGDIDCDSLKIDNVDILDEIEGIKTINGQYLTDNSINNAKIIDLIADKISAGTITGSTIKTGEDGSTRVELKSNWADIDLYHDLLRLLTIYDGGTYTNIFSPSNKPIIIGNNDYTGVVSAQGDWDFTSASVTGIVGVFG